MRNELTGVAFPSIVTAPCEGHGVSKRCERNALTGAIFLNRVTRNALTSAAFPNSVTRNALTSAAYQRSASKHFDAKCVDSIAFPNCAAECAVTYTVSKLCDAECADWHSLFISL